MHSSVILNVLNWCKMIRLGCDAAAHFLTVKYLPHLGDQSDLQADVPATCCNHQDCLHYQIIRTISIYRYSHYELL